MPRASKGVLIELDPSIKAIVLKLDAAHEHAFVIEDLDEGALVVKESRLAELRALLDQELKTTQLQEEESDSE